MYTLLRAMALRRLLFEATTDAPFGTPTDPHRGDGVANLTPALRADQGRPDNGDSGRREHHQHPVVSDHRRLAAVARRRRYREMQHTSVSTIEWMRSKSWQH